MRAFAPGLLIGAYALQQQAVLPALLWLVGLALLAALLLCCAKRYARYRYLLVLISGIAVGFAWAAWRADARLAVSLPQALEGQDLQVTGVIDSLPDDAGRGIRFYFATEKALQADQQAVHIPARIALGWYASDTQDYPVVHPGERWQFTLRLQRPHGNANPFVFDYEAWLLAEGVRATGYVRPGTHSRLDAFVSSPGTLINLLRDQLRQRIVQALPDRPYRGVIVALVVGDQRAIDAADWTIFNRTGIGHLISISGLHITMIAALCAALIQALWRRSFFTRANLPLYLPAQKASAAAGLAAALIYVALAGFGIPAQRTLIMLAVVALALWSGRIAAVSQILAIAIATVILFDPWAVMWPGFWLSFLAIACIVFVSAGRFGNMSTGRWQNLQSAAHSQYAVTLGLLPISILLFGQVSVVSPLANAVAIPLVSFLVTPLSLLGSVAPAPLCVWLLQCSHALMAMLAQWLEWISGLPFAVWHAPQPDALTFGLALAGMIWLLAPRGWPCRWLGLLTWLPIMTATPAAPLKGIWITAWDIGQGNAVLIETATHRLLYDTGLVYSGTSDAATRVMLPYLHARGITRLDGLMISHSDTDHSGGAMSMLKNIDIGWVSSSLPPSHQIVTHAPNHHVCATGQSWAWDGVQFEVLQPEIDSYAVASLKPNARSCALKITYEGKAVLLTGDIESAQERALLERLPARLRADVLLAPHHGSGTSSTLPFLEAVAPSVAVFQVGYRNRYHHPKPEVFARYQALGIQRLRTDESGALQIVIDEDVHVSALRSQHARYWHAR